MISDVNDIRKQALEAYYKRQESKEEREIKKLEKIKEMDNLIEEFVILHKKKILSASSKGKGSINIRFPFFLPFGKKWNNYFRLIETLEFFSACGRGGTYYIYQNSRFSLRYLQEELIFRWIR